MSKVEIRAVGDLSFTMDGGKPRIDARAIRYDSWSVDLGGFRERVMPDAMTLDPDLVALFDHDSSMVLGRISAGTLEVRQDSQGIGFTAYLPETTWANDLRVSMMRGDIKGCSFRMMVDEDKWYVNRDGQVCRDIVKAHVSELTVTSMPAYPETTAEARSTAKQLAATESRAGRVISGANEIALKAALEALDLAETTLESVLQQLDPTFMPESESEDDGTESCDCGGDGCTGCDCSTEMSDPNCSCPDAECATCNSKNSETMDGASNESRSSDGASETPITRSAYTRFGFISTRKDR